MHTEATPQKPCILAQREASGPTSAWTEYLRVRQDETRGPVLEVCRYEALEYWEGSEDDDGNPLPLPEFVDGKKVVALEDDQLVGGDLICWTDDDQLVMRRTTLSPCLMWCHNRGFKVDRAVADVIKAQYPPRVDTIIDPELEMREILSSWFDFSKPISEAETDAGVTAILAAGGGLFEATLPGSREELMRAVGGFIKRHNARC